MISLIDRSIKNDSDIQGIDVRICGWQGAREPFIIAAPFELVVLSDPELFCL
jgi:hypothetical protein